MAQIEEIEDKGRVTQHEDGSVTLDVSKETMDKILHPYEGPKKASELTEVDDLKFQMGKLRTHLATWDIYVEHQGNLYLLQVDPLNKMVKFLSKEAKQQ